MDGIVVHVSRLHVVEASRMNQDEAVSNIHTNLIFIQQNTKHTFIKYNYTLLHQNRYSRLSF